jgi:predicted nucleic acid-binding protein
MIIVDSSLLIAALAERDTNHLRALAVISEIRRGDWGPALLPDYILVEVANWLVRKRGFEAAAAFVRAMCESGESRVLPCSTVLQRAIDLFLGQRGRRLGLADCAILSLAETHGVPNVATFDAAFRAIPGLNVIDCPRAS